MGVAVLDDVRRPGGDRGARGGDLGDDAVVGAPLLLVHGDADVAALGVEELQVRVGGQELLALVGHLRAVAAAGDRRTDELGADGGRVQVLVVALELEGVVLVPDATGSWSGSVSSWDRSPDMGSSSCVGRGGCQLSGAWCPAS